MLTPAEFHAEARKRTPWEFHGGIHFKREDKFHPGQAYGGVNSSKLRAAAHIFEQRGNATHILTAASGLSPQHAIVAFLSQMHGIPHTHITGAKAISGYPSLVIAQMLGASFVHPNVGYQPALNKKVHDLHAETPGSYIVPYGLGPTDPKEYAAFYEVNARQVENTPSSVTTLYVPAGSCHTLLSIIKGLERSPHNVSRLVSVGVGPNKVAWVKERLVVMGINPYKLPFEWDTSISLHDMKYASYGDKMPEHFQGIDFHPTYEGKVWRYLRDSRAFEYNGHEGFWVVGAAPNPQVVRDSPLL